MDEEVELPQVRPSALNTASTRALVGHVARQHELGADLGGERLDPLLDGVALIGERDLGALIGHGLGDAPGDRAVVGDAEHEAALARHQFAAFGHRSPALRKEGLYMARDSRAGRLFAITA